MSKITIKCTAAEAAELIKAAKVNSIEIVEVDKVAEARKDLMNKMYIADQAVEALERASDDEDYAHKDVAKAKAKLAELEAEVAESTKLDEQTLAESADHEENITPKESD